MWLLTSIPDALFWFPGSIKAESSVSQLIMGMLGLAGTGQAEVCGEGYHGIKSLFAPALTEHVHL